MVTACSEGGRWEGLEQVPTLSLPLGLCVVRRRQVAPYTARLTPGEGGGSFLWDQQGEEMERRRQAAPAGTRDRCGWGWGLRGPELLRAGASARAHCRAGGGGRGRGAAGRAAGLYPEAVRQRGRAVPRLLGGWLAARGREGARGKKPGNSLARGVGTRFHGSVQPAGGSCPRTDTLTPLPERRPCSQLGPCQPPEGGEARG